ncbi:MAG: metal ABC transporter permease [Gammaproteobacteria bacterium]
MTGIDVDILGLPLLAGLLVIATHVPLGREVLRRGIIFIDLAVAQIAGLGVIAALLLGWDVGGWRTQAVAFIGAVLGAVLIRGFERYWPDIQEALIGITFVLAATTGVLLLAGNPHGAEHLSELLAGQLLWVTADQLQTAALIYLPVIMLWFWLGPGRLRFYMLFALTVTVSVQLVGVYLVFSSLIIPAVAIRRLQGVVAIAAGYVLGIIAFAGGLLCSLWFDWPAGPAVVWLLGLTGIIFGIVASYRFRDMQQG